MNLDAILKPGAIAVITGAAGGIGLAAAELCARRGMKVALADRPSQALDCAREAGLRITAHAGEWKGPDEVRAAINDLGAERIGHGVRAIEDMALVEEIAERGVVLELCPGSNVALGIYPSFRKHPIGEMYDRGVKVTINTDDPPFFHTTMTREYDMLNRAFDWDEAVFQKIARTSLDAAFCDADTKTRLLNMLEQADG